MLLPYRSWAENEQAKLEPPRHSSLPCCWRRVLVPVWAGAEKQASKMSGRCFGRQASRGDAVPSGSSHSVMDSAEPKLTAEPTIMAILLHSIGSTPKGCVVHLLPCGRTAHHPLTKDRRYVMARCLHYKQQLMMIQAMHRKVKNSTV